MADLSLRQKLRGKKLYLIRHAESTANAKAANSPDTDHWNAALTPKGIAQAAELIGKIPLLLVSPMRRTLQTSANIVCKRKQLVEELREWKGWGPSCLYETEPITTKETWQEFEGRVRKAILVIADQPEERIAIVSHGGTLGEICKQLNLPCYSGWHNAECRLFRL
jgi:broad specificity phosphatase PhoE